jgi:hypothetical protein
MPEASSIDINLTMTLDELCARAARLYLGIHGNDEDMRVSALSGLSADQAHRVRRYVDRLWGSNGDAGKALDIRQGHIALPDDWKQAAHLIAELSPDDRKAYIAGQDPISQRTIEILVRRVQSSARDRVLVAPGMCGWHELLDAVAGPAGSVFYMER